MAPFPDSRQAEMITLRMKQLHQCGAALAEEGSLEGSPHGVPIRVSLHSDAAISCRRCSRWLAPGELGFLLEHGPSGGASSGAPTEVPESGTPMMWSVSPGAIA